MIADSKLDKLRAWKSFEKEAANHKSETILNRMRRLTLAFICRPHQKTRQTGLGDGAQMKKNDVCTFFSRRGRAMTELQPQNPGELTQLLIAWSEGDEGALDQLAPLVYGELRKMARRSMRRERADHTLQTTALVHEAFLRLIGHPQERWRNQAHFYGIAAGMMRRVLVDFARTRLRAKRGGAAVRISLEDADAQVESPARNPDLLSLDAALAELQRMDPRRARVVELRFFLGLEVEETARILDVSPDTVIRDWRVAKAWLYRRLQHAN